MIPLCAPHFAGREAELLQECLASTFVSSVGPFVEEFERRFAAAVGAPRAVACSSGTAAIHLALRGCGVGPGDRVAVADFTFIASATPIVHCGATPLLIGSEPTTWNMDPQALEDCIRAERLAGRRLAAVVAVHIYGVPARLAEVAAICDREGISLIEDATESLGARAALGSAQRATGTVGRAGCFSFNGNKLITTGGGGMVVTADSILADRLKHLSTQAKLPGPGFVHDQVGYNYRMPNLNAALGLAQLEQIDDLLARKASIAARYRAAGLNLQPAAPHDVPSHWMSVCCLPPGIRDHVCTRLLADDIEVRPGWRPLSRQPALAGAPRWGSDLADILGRDTLCLPCSAGLPVEDQERVIASLRRYAGLRE